MLAKVDHVGLAVADLGAAIDLYAGVWGLSVEHREVVEDQGVEEAMIRVGDCYIQLLSSLSADTPVGRFVARRGEGIHHIAYEVEDIEAALSTLASEGIPLIDSSPRAGSRNTRVAFVHPSGTLGVLVELVQHPRRSSGNPGPV